MRVFCPVLVEGRDGREPERLPVVGCEDEGPLDEAGRFALEPVAVGAGERLGLGEKSGHRVPDLGRPLPVVPDGGRIEPARLPEQGVETGRDKRESDTEGNGGAPVGPCAGRAVGHSGRSSP